MRGVKPAPLRSVLTPLLAILLLGGASAATQQDVPDLTRGDRIPEKATHDWNLGATGARGWMHSERMVTKHARQIAVTAVAAGSPADGVLAVGDVILGVGGEAFEGDPRTAFGQALTAAESEVGGGRLALRRWRAGQVEDVVVELPVLGSYSATAPFDCEKSARILDAGCEAIARGLAASNQRPPVIPRCLNALALLASGEKKYWPLVAAEARWAAGFEADSMQTWYYGYVCMLLAEYVAMTGDEAVLPGLRRLALQAATGQSRVGSWGHKFAQPDGRLAGYGMMNAPGVPLTIGLRLAREAGVDDAEVAAAIERSAKLLRFYVGKGAIPYGDHDPWIETHEDNGKCGMGAVLFDLLGEKAAASFFVDMCTASHGPERDTGHTGNFFNVAWAMPGVARGGKHAAGAWMAEFGAWYFDLARQWDGSFQHQGPPEEKPDSYRGWDATGAILLGYAMPRRQLMLTGRLGTKVDALTAKEAQTRIEEGRGWDNQDRTSFDDGLAEAEQMERLTSWSPVVRERAAMSLARRRADVVPQLIKRVASKDTATRQGACQGLAQLRGAAADAVPALRRALRDKDLWVRVLAAKALARIGPKAKGALPDLLEALSRTPGGKDPRGMEQRYLCFSMFDRREGLLRHGFDGVDRSALHTAIRAGLRNEDGRARSAVSNVYATLPFEWLEPLLPEIYEATMQPSPSGIMFAHGVRVDGLKLMAQHHIEEGLAACVHYVRHQKPHASEHRTPEILAILSGYGAHAQAFIPQLEETAAYFENDEPDFPKRLSLQKAAAVREAIVAIRASTDRPKLTSIR
jgi:hypothetical protein